MSTSNNSGSPSNSKVNYVYYLKLKKKQSELHLEFGSTCVSPCLPNPLANTLPLNSLPVHASAWKDTTSVARNYQHRT